MLNKSEILKKLIQEYDVITTRYVQEMQKSELEYHLVYDKYNNQSKSTTNSRNGYRNYKSDISGIEEQITAMYSKGVFTI